MQRILLELVSKPGWRSRTPSNFRTSCFVQRVLKRLVVAACVLGTTLPAIADDVDADFQKGVEATGAEFATLRDRLVATATDDYLKKKAESSDFRERLVASIVQGWQANGPLYKERITAKTFVSNGGFTHFVWIPDPESLKGPFVPLALEMLFKKTADKVGMDAAVRLLAAAGRRNEREGADLLIEFLSQTPVPDVETGTRAAAALVAYPHDVISIDDTLKMMKHLGTEQDRGPKIAFVLGGLITLRLEKLSEDEKSKIVSQLVSEEELLGSLGPETTLRIAGTIGGPKAVEGIGKYLRGVDKPGKQKWAFDLLSHMPNRAGQSVLIDYARDAKMPQNGRTMAIEGLVLIGYTARTADTLKAILEDETAPPRVRFEALRSLDQFLQIEGGRYPQIGAFLRNAILETKFAPDAKSGFQSAAESITTRVRASK